MTAGCHVVIGDTSVARRVCSSLTQRGHDVCHAARPDDAELAQALDGRADGIAILLQDDVIALRYALAVAHIQPAAPMVVTIFDRAIGDQLERFLPQCEVTSPADLAAPSLAGPCVASGLLAVTRSGDRTRGVRSVGGVLDEVSVEIRTRPRWRAAGAALTGLLRSHDTGTRILPSSALRESTRRCRSPPAAPADTSTPLLPAHTPAIRARYPSEPTPNTRPPDHPEERRGPQSDHRQR
ncbi:MAG TPA: hypothetical protein VIW24_29145 [Aldersonia sp.]